MWWDSPVAKTKKPQRPENVTMPAIFLGLTAMLSVFYISSVLGSWTSLETQEAITTALGDANLGQLSDETAMTAIRVIFFGILIASIAAVVFSVFVLRGDKASRIGLSVLGVLAALLFVTGGLAGLIPALFSAVSVGLLWSAPARAWFDSHAQIHQSATASVVTETAPPSQVVAAKPAASVAAVVSLERPGILTAALVVTAVFSSLVLLAAALWLIVVSGNPGALVDAIENHPLASVRELPDMLGQSAQEVVSTASTVMAVLGALSLVSLVSAGLAYFRKPGSREFLMVMSLIAMSVSVLAFPAGLPWALASAFVFYVTLRLDVKMWFREST